MADSKFSLDDPAFEDSTRQVIRPEHVMAIQEEAGVDTQLFQTPPGSPVPPDQSEEKEGDEQAADAPENSLLKCIMVDACDHELHAFQEYEHYSFVVNSGSDCDVPEDELADEMEDISGDEDQLDPVSLQEEEGPTEGDHDQPNPVIIPVEDIIAIEGNETSPVNLHVTLVNVQVTEPKDPSTPRRLDFNIAALDSVYPEADQEVIPENQLDVKVQAVTTTSTAEGESISSSRILMDIHVDPKPPESENSYELLHKDVNETPVKRAIEAGAPET